MPKADPPLRYPTQKAEADSRRADRGLLTADPSSLDPISFPLQPMVNLYPVMGGTRKLWELLLVVLFLGFIVAEIPFILTPHSLDYDEGVYWQTLSWLHKDKAIYTEIFYSQLPLFIYALWIFGAVFGDSFVTYRAAILLFSLPVIPLLYYVGLKLKDRNAGRFAALTGLLSPALFYRSHVIQGNVPSVTFGLAAFAMALASRGSPHSLLLVAGSGVLLGVAVNFKLLILPAAVVLVFACGERIMSRAFYIKGAVLGASFLASTFLLAFGLGWDLTGGLGQLNGGAATSPIRSQFFRRLPQRFHDIYDLFPTEYTDGFFLFLVGLALCLWCWRSLKEAALPLLWVFIFFLAFMVYSVFNPHYTVMMTPGIALLVGIGFSSLLARWNSVGGHSFESRAAPFIVFIVLAINTYYFVPVYGRHYEKIADYQSSIDSFVATIRENIKEGEYLASDDQFLVALAGRQVPPPLVDTSFARIRSRSLTCPAFIQSISAPNVKGVLAITGRFPLLKCDKEIFAALGRETLTTVPKIGGLVLKR